MKTISIFISILICFFACSPKKAPVASNKNYTVIKVHEGTNKYFCVATVVETENVLTKNDLVQIRNKIGADKTITQHNVIDSPVIYKNKGKAYALLLKDKSEKPFKDIHVPLDTLNKHFHKMISAYENKKYARENNMKISEAYIPLKYAFYNSYFYWLAPGESGYEEEKYNYDYLWRNNKGFGQEVRIENGEFIKKDMTGPITYDKLIFLDSGDMLLYSTRHKGNIMYYLKIK